MHPLLVLVAWIKLNRSFPSFYEFVCIMIHDVGHVGKNYLSDVKEKHKHWELGAMLAQKLFGYKGYLMVAGHTMQSGHKRSKLYLPDKYSWIIAPLWWLRLNDKVENFGDRVLEEWLEKIRENFNKGCPKGNHQLFLELRDGRKK